MPEYEKIIKDQEQCMDNLKDALEYEKNLNHQLMGKLDDCQNTVKMILRLLIDKATERR